MYIIISERRQPLYKGQNGWSGRCSLLRDSTVPTCRFSNLFETGYLCHALDMYLFPTSTIDCSCLFLHRYQTMLEADYKALFVNNDRDNTLFNPTIRDLILDVDGDETRSPLVNGSGECFVGEVTCRYYTLLASICGNSTACLATKQEACCPPPPPPSPPTHP